MTDASRHIRDAIDQPKVDEPTIDRLLDGAVRRRGAMVRRRRVVAASSVLAIAAVGVFVLRAPNQGGALRRTDGAPIASIVTTDAAPSRVAFDDGSSVVLSPSSALRVAHNDQRRVDWTLERGVVRFSVRPRGPRRWTIDAGLAVVSVIGTEFVVDRTADRVRVSVSEGVVRVETRELQSRIHRMTAGQSIVVEARPAVADPSIANAASADDASASGPAIPAGDDASTSAALEGGLAMQDDASSASDAARIVRAPATARPAWRSLAEQGEYSRAYELLGTDGVARASRGSSADSLLALADVARLSGHPSEAVAPLEQLLREHPADSAAPLAAYTLGRVFVSLGRHAEAARSFDRAIALGAPRAIEEDLRWLLVRSRNASGDRSGAERAAEEYRARFSDGRHARAIDDLLGARR
ncbi:MAG: FecR domain-containing protein [Myxococcales bacterium]|nr:FecR domain-containing protein [Myxococcales bacterium]